MAYDRIVISSGHGKYVRGASGIIDEVDEASTCRRQNCPMRCATVA